MRATALTATAAAALLVLATPSAAAPDRTVELSREVRSTSWSTGLNVGMRSGAADIITECQDPAFSCDETLINLVVPGDLKVEASETTPVRQPYPSLLVSVYKSDAAGVKGALLGRQGFRATVSVVAPGLRPGFYLAVISWDQGGGTFAALATLAPKRR